MAVRAHCRSRHWRRTAIPGLLPLPAVLAAAPAAAARPAAPPAVTAVAFSPDGALLAAGYADGALRLWVAATGQETGPVLRSGSGPVTAVAFSPHGALLVSADADGTIRRWNPAKDAAM